MLNNIVIFGMDNTGKTTLGKQLASTFNMDYIHSPGLVDLEEKKKFMEENLAEGKKIFDRFPIIEEDIYGNILRNKNELSNEDYVNNILGKVDLFIYCNPGLFNTLKWGEREQMEGVKEYSLDLINAFNKKAVELKEKGYSVIEYNYNVPNIITAIILEALKNE